MATTILAFLLKFLTVDNLCTVLAKAISLLLAYASKKGGKAWDTAKAAILKINVWTSLFLQVYDDDNMNAEEEKLVADAIKSKTDIAKVVDIIKKANEDKKI